MTEQNEDPQQDRPLNDDPALNGDEEKTSNEGIGLDVANQENDDLKDSESIKDVKDVVDVVSEDLDEVMSGNEFGTFTEKDIDINSDKMKISSDVPERPNGEEESISAVTFPQLEVAVVDKQDHPDRLNNVYLDLSVELGRKEMTVEEVSTMKVHDVIELSKLAGEAFEIRINGRIFAVGDVVIIGQNMAVRLTSMINQGDPLK
jgi:flagellar motor switch protein FliN/FliY